MPCIKFLEIKYYVTNNKWQQQLINVKIFRNCKINIGVSKLIKNHKAMEKRTMKKTRF